MRLPNGFGSISKMSGRRRKPWRVRITAGWTPDGKQIYKNLGTYATRREALEALTEWNANPLDRAEKVRKEETKRGLTFADVYTALMKYKEEKASADTIKNYQTAYNNLATLHNRIFNSIRKPHLQEVMDNCPKSSSTKHKMKVLLNAMYKYAIEYELAETNYAQMLEKEPNVNENDYAPFTETEIEQLWEYSKADDIAKIILIQIYTGCRVRELLNLEKGNVFLDKEYAIGGMKTEAGKERIIPFHKRIVPLIEYFYNNDRPFLFINSRKTRMKYEGFNQNFSDRMEQWGMEHKTHDCRRTAATRLSIADVPYHIVQQIIGHSMKKVVTDRYIFKDAKQLIKYVNYVK